MAKKLCYICSSETDTNKNLFNDAVLEICSNCDRNLTEFTSSFLDFENRSCKKNLGIRQHSEKNIRRNLIEAKRRISNDEKIVDYLLGLSFGGLAIYTGMILLTNKRLILFIPKPAGMVGDVIGCSYEYSSQLEDIIELLNERNLMSHSITIRDKGGMFKASKDLKILESDSQFQLFVNSFNLQKNESSKSNNIQTTQIIQQSDNLDKIKKLKEMLDLGILTTEEYEMKKKQLLEDL